MVAIDSYNMKHISTSIFALVILVSCQNTNSSIDNSIRILQTSYSPDKRCYFTITEFGIDSNDIDASTQVMVNFKRTGSGAYSIRGINKKLKAYWKDNSTIVIETFKTYESGQKWPQVQSFNDIIRIEYLEK